MLIIQMDSGGGKGRLDKLLFSLRSLHSAQPGALLFGRNDSLREEEIILLEN